MKKIYIVMINYNGQENTIECLDSLLRLKTDGFELQTIVVDNYPENKIKVDVSKYSKIKLRVIFNPVNSGFSGGMNIGIKHALKNGGDYVLIHNNDTFVKEDFLQKLFDFAEKTEKAGIVAPKIYFAKGYEFHKDRYKEEELGHVFWYAGGNMDWKNVIGHHRGVDEIDHGQYDKIEETDFATGCSMLVKSEVFNKVDLLDEAYFLYYEDSDFSKRAKDARYKIYYLPSSVVWHKNAGSTGGSGSKLQDYYITRNRMYFGMKFASTRSKVALLREGVRNILSGREWQKAGAIDYFLGRMGKATRF
ncbi:MAG: glycosyltransferase family 2 protein [Patescibacteria group bacterium]